MKILVIGGTGIIGGSIAYNAIKMGYDVTIICRNNVPQKLKNINFKFNLLKGDWFDNSFARSSLNNFFDVIIDTQIFNVFQLKRTIHLIKKKCKHFIYVSTDSVYKHPGNFVNENCVNKKELVWKYGLDKYLAEKELFNNTSDFSFNWTIIRPTLTFGETRLPIGFTSKRNTSSLIKRIIKGKPIVTFGNLDEPHALCDANEFGEVVVKLFLNPSCYRNAYHISDDNTYSYNSIFNILENTLSQKVIKIGVDVQCLKKYNIDFFEEQIYDKIPKFTLNNEKVKEVTNISCIRANMQNSITATIHNLINKDEDKEFDKISDAILLDQVNNLKNEKDKYIVKQYLQSLPKEYYKDLLQYNIRARKLLIFKFLLKEIRNFKSKFRPIKILFISLLLHFKK